MELLILAVAILLIGMLGVAANEIGADSRDNSADPAHREPVGLS